MQKWILAGIFGIAFIARALLIWLTRPEYVGWFNHSYYYWVQTRGLLIDGALPYADLPLIFYAYAAIASVLQAFGMDPELAIINAARFSMSLVPALVAMPAFYTLQRINQGQPLHRSMWLLVGVAAFLPLTTAYMPELLQKNMLGILLLFTLNWIVYVALQERSKLHLAFATLLVLAIALTHLGTLAVSIAYAVALAAACIYETGVARQPVRTTAALLVLAGASAATIAYLDPEAFSRVARYAQSSLPNSLLGRLAAGGSVLESLLLVGAILVPILMAFVLLRAFGRQRDKLAVSDRIFWLSHILLAYLLLAPVIDLEVMPRFLLFLPLPAIIVLAFHLRTHHHRWTLRLTVAAAAIGALLMMIGDVTGVLLQYPDKTQTRAELDDMRERFDLGSGDLVLTPYGGNTICNWFLGTRAGLITAFDRSDMQQYARIFVLNPRDAPALGRAADRMNDGRITFETEQQKYEAMRLNVPIAGRVPNMINYQFLSFHRLDAIPGDWLFDGNGNWIGADYSKYLEE
jgi:hypothetical protein